MKHLFVSLMIALLTAGCGDRIEPGQTAMQPAVVKGLETTTVMASGSAVGHFLPGTVVSPDRAVITARIAGQVDRPLVFEGQFVKQGTPLLVLAGETVSSELKAAQAAVAMAQSQEVEARVNAELAAKNAVRYARLLEKAAVTPLENDQVQAARATSQERLATADAALAGSLAQRDRAQIMAGMATLTAPYDATVVEIMADAGTTVQPGSPLLTLDRSGPWQVRVELPENTAGHYQIGDTFIVDIPAIAQLSTATLAELLPAVDERTRTFTAKLKLPELAGLRSGLFTKVGIAGEAGSSSLYIPTAAVVNRGQLTSVYVVEDQLLHYRLVRTGATAGDQVAILAGLAAGEVIVVKGLERASHGARLESAQ